MGRALLMANQDVPDRVFAQRVVDRQNGAAGIAEHFTNALPFQCCPDDLSAGEARRVAGGGFRCFAHGWFLLGGICKKRWAPRSAHCICYFHLMFALSLTDTTKALALWHANQ